MNDAPVLEDHSTKTEPVGFSPTAMGSKPRSVTDSTISIADLLDIVKDIMPAGLSHNVLNHYNLTRKNSKTEKLLKFQDRGTVEETKNLVAVHNTDEAKLMAALKLGGLPMPSIAIVKSEMGHNSFGDISLNDAPVLEDHSNIIDKNRANDILAGVGIPSSERTKIIGSAVDSIAQVHRQSQG